METNAEILAWNLRNAGETERREAERSRYRFVCSEYLHDMGIFFRAYPQDMPAEMAAPPQTRGIRRNEEQRGR